MRGQAGVRIVGSTEPVVVRSGSVDDATRGRAITTMRIGLVGTGTMGTPIAGCLIRAGHSLSVYDRRTEATAALCAQGAV